MVTITLRFIDASSRHTLPCWVELRGADGTVVSGWNVHSELAGFPCDGEVELSLSPGRYELLARRWISHQWLRAEVEVTDAPAQVCEFQLQPWLDPKRLGYVCLDAHNHVNHPNLLRDAVRFGAALELDAVELCQGWTVDPVANRSIAGVAIADSIRAASTSAVHLAFGIERPKTRFGHWWWVNVQPPALPFVEYDGWHDAAFCEWIALQPQPAHDVQEACPFEGELPFDELRRQRSAGAAAVAAHPTSWWWETKDGRRSFTSNLSLDSIYCLLAGEAPDAIVVMGYDADQIFYQNLWFRLLNEGYTIAGAAETDAALRGGHYLGQLRQYLRLGGLPNESSSWATALAAGRALMTSGPFIEFSADGGLHRSGDHVLLGDAAHTLEIEAWSAAAPTEFISFIILYRNGRPYAIEDYVDERPRHVTRSFNIIERDRRAWYVAKVYGASHPQRPEFFDVLEYAELCEREPHEEYKSVRSVAITNPIYFEAADWSPPAPVWCEARIRVTDSASGQRLDGVTVNIVERDGVVTVLTDAGGAVSLRLLPTAVLELAKDGYGSRRVSILLDYAPVRRCIEYGFTGQWLYDQPNTLSPGQAPWRAFQVEPLRASLSQIDWEIAMEPISLLALRPKLS